ncbi:MAG TPA: carbohydrate kinase [Caulobacteraceae bacterium]|nr:carbohydrate kinase [Caulobacteraceae bacterium]
MGDGLIVVLDVGKTLAKLSLWTRAGELVDRTTRANDRLVSERNYLALDAVGIEAWLAGALAGFARHGRVGTIVPVAHGAAAAIVRDGALACPPLDYEQAIPAARRLAYEAQRDKFGQTGSPSLPDGLNLGAQLDYLEAVHPGILAEGAMILPWPQYWAWRLTGIAASEVTSLGCHSDLWRPRERAPSDLARARGWADRLAPLVPAGEVLGPLSESWARRTGLGTQVQVLCGLHDSNAALLTARGFPEIARRESTVLSTGTWFVAMRSPKDDRSLDVEALAEARDCLVNIDAYGKLIPSARFMGGREIEILSGADARRVDIGPGQPSLVAAVPDLVARASRVLPTFAPGSGPFPHHRGRWIDMPDNPVSRRAAVCLYAALVADVSLGLIGAEQQILVEGRFAEAEVFVRALASLRPHDRIYVSNARYDLSYGALRLVEPTLRPQSALAQVRPLEVDLDGYGRLWAEDVGRAEHG